MLLLLIAKSRALNTQRGKISYQEQGSILHKHILIAHKFNLLRSDSFVIIAAKRVVPVKLKNPVSTGLFRIERLANS